MIHPTLYFAYGSLLDRERMAQLNGEAKPVMLARLAHHAVCFSGRSKSWGGGTATIAAATGRDLWGALYEIDAACRQSVEQSGAEDGYVWSFTSVETADGVRTRAGLLVKVRDLEPSPPSEDYLAAMRAGWEQWGLGPQEVLDDCKPPA